jgi:Fe2+ transport system protein FeoA
MTVCSLCGFAYAPGGAVCRERACPMAVFGCTLEHCPRCGFSAPDERSSRLARWVRRMLSRPKLAESADATSVADLRPGTSATIKAVGGAPEVQARLAAQGLVAGAGLRLVQRWPSYVIEMGDTTLAFERTVAESVRVETCGATGRAPSASQAGSGAAHTPFR